MWEQHLLLRLRSQHLHCCGDDDALQLLGVLQPLDAQLLPDAQQPLVRGDGGDVEQPLLERDGDGDGDGDDDDDGVVQLLQERDDDDGRDDEPQLCRDDDHDGAVLKLYLCRWIPLL